VVFGYRKYPGESHHAIVGGINNSVDQQSVLTFLLLQQIGLFVFQSRYFERIGTTGNGNAVIFANQID